MADHDQRFKTLLEEFFPEFFQLFFPDWAGRFDFGRVEWLRQELFPDPPQGERRAIDLLAKLPTRQAVPGQRSGQEDSWLALIHVEVEGEDTVAPLRSRMCDYYGFLRHKHRLPVLPVAVYLRVGLEGLGRDVYEEQFWDWTVLRFEYLYVGLPALDAEQYVGGSNWLGVALTALMRLRSERTVELGLRALQGW